jgi:pilus assembly protein CpaB
MPSKGKVLDYPNLEFLTVGAVTNSKAQNTDEVMKNQNKASSSGSTDTIIPTTITLLASKEQARELVDAENSGTIHVVFRGRDREVEKLLEVAKAQNTKQENKNTDTQKTVAPVKSLPDTAKQVQKSIPANIQKSNQSNQNTGKDNSQFNLK